MIGNVIAFFAGGFCGVLAMALVAGRAYDKGRNDERRLYRR